MIIMDQNNQTTDALVALNEFHISLGPNIVLFHEFKKEVLANEGRGKPVKFTMDSGEPLIALFRPLLPDLERLDEPVTFILATSAHPERATILTTDFKNLESAGFLRNKNTMILVHGWRNSVDDAFPRIAAAAFLRQPECNPCNVVLVNWDKEAADKTYLPARNFAQKGLASKICELLVHLVENQFVCSGDLHLIGYSMGSHGSGIACKLFSERINQKPGRLDGLDPPWFGFEMQWWNISPDRPVTRMDSTDALLCTGIYTSKLQTGPNAQLNYYPNNGDHPGSTLLIEDHFRSVAFYVDSILHPNNPFLATKATSWEAFLEGENLGTELMGCRINQAAKPGCYFLRTNETSPYAIRDP